MNSWIFIAIECESPVSRLWIACESQAVIKCEECAMRFASTSNFLSCVIALGISVTNNSIKRTNQRGNRRGIPKRHSEVAKSPWAMSQCEEPKTELGTSVCQRKTLWTWWTPYTDAHQSIGCTQCLARCVCVLLLETLTFASSESSRTRLHFVFLGSLLSGEFKVSLHLI